MVGYMVVGLQEQFPESATNSLPKVGKDFMFCLCQRNSALHEIN